MIGTTTALIIAASTMAAGTAISATGQVKAGNAAKRAGESMAQREEYNAALAEQQAVDAIARGETEANRFRSQVRQLIGSQRVGYASQNVEIGSGSALDVQRDAQHLGDLDIAQIRENAQREAWGYRAEAEDRRMGANVARMGGNAAATAGRFGAASTALGGASSILLNTYGWPRRA